jgi:hypothetical protein
MDVDLFAVAIYLQRVISVPCLFFFTLVGIMLAQESEDREKLFDYFHNASILAENSAYRFEGQTANSRNGEEPSITLFKGLTAKSQKKDLEYNAFISTKVPSSTYNGETNLVRHQEFFRVGSSRSRRAFAIPDDGNGVGSRFKGQNGRGAPLLDIGLDDQGTPLPSPKVLRLWFPIWRAERPILRRQECWCSNGRIPDQIHV